MVAEPERHHDTLVQLMVDVAGMEDFPKLRRHEDAARLISDARAAVEQLRAMVKPYEQELLEREQARERIAGARAQGEQRRAFAGRLEALKARYLELVTSQDPRAPAATRWRRSCATCSPCSISTHAPQSALRDRRKHCCPRGCH